MERISIVILYFFIALFPTLIGAMSGLGGGIFIKPILDTLGDYNLETIGVLSTSTVLAMAAISLIRLRTTSVKINTKVSAFLAVGSVFGGIAGKIIFNYAVITLELESVIGMVQSASLASILVIIILYFRFKSSMKAFSITNRWTIFIAGFILGIISSFLGIGGGPFNIAVLALLFSMEGKARVINSTFIIFCSQLASLLTITFTTGFSGLDLSMLPSMIIGGILGGLIGSALLTQLSNQSIFTIFNVSAIIILLLNIFNLVIAIQ